MGGLILDRADLSPRNQSDNLPELDTEGQTLIDTVSTHLKEIATKKGYNLMSPKVILTYDEPGISYGLSTSQLKVVVIQIDSLTQDNSRINIYLRKKRPDEITADWAYTVGTQTEPVQKIQRARDQWAAQNFGEAMASSYTGYDEIPVPTPQFRLERHGGWKPVFTQDIEPQDITQVLHTLFGLVSNPNSHIQIFDFPQAI